VLPTRPTHAELQADYRALAGSAEPWVRLTRVVEDTPHPHAGPARPARHTHPVSEGDESWTPGDDRRRIQIGVKLADLRPAPPAAELAGRIRKLYGSGIYSFQLMHQGKILAQGKIAVPSLVKVRERPPYKARKPDASVRRAKVRAR
jgi:hypothetical protein